MLLFTVDDEFLKSYGNFIVFPTFLFYNIGKNS